MVFVSSPVQAADSAAAVETPLRRTLGNLVIDGIPELPPELFERLNQYQNTRYALVQDWDPAGGLLILTRFGETAQVHRVARPGGDRRQLTFFDERVSTALASPKPETPGFLFARDVGGGEFFQLYFYDGASGRSRLLTDGGRTQNSAPKWSNRGDRFAYTSTRRNRRDRDVYVSGIEGASDAPPVLEVSGWWRVLDWSPDDAQLLLHEYISVNESRLHLLTLATGQARRLLPRDEPVAYGDAAFTRDGKGVFLTSDQDAEFLRLRHLNLAAGQLVELAPDLAWDVTEIELSKDGKTLAFAVNEGGLSRLHVLDTATLKTRALKPLPAGTVDGLDFHPTAPQLAFTLAGPRTPGDAYVCDVSKDRMERWTHSEVGGLDPEKFVAPEIVHFPTFDQADGKARQIPAFYYRPPGPGPFPTMIVIHGGPEGQAQATFSPTIAYFTTELGIAVIAPNVRGSTGYGKTYVKLDNGRQREDAVRDIGALLDWVSRRPELDANRVAVYGGSYGGYMVLASMVHYSDRLRCGIDVVGISNWLTFLQNTESYRQDLRRAEYGDERDPEMRAFLESISPLTHASRINRPLFVVQGLNDPRVPAGEAEQIVRAVRDNGQPVWYLLANDEGHGFAKKSNRDFLFAAMVRFLETHLLP